MIKKSKFDLLDDEFILHLQENDLDPLELPDDDTSTKEKIEEIEEDGEKMWWIGTPNTARASQLNRQVNLDSVGWLLAKLTIFIPLILYLLFPIALMGLLLVIWGGVIGIAIFSATYSESLNPHRNVRYYVSNQDIQFIYPSLNHSFEVNWEDVLRIAFHKRGSKEEVEFILNRRIPKMVYEFDSGEPTHRLMIQELKRMDRVHEKLTKLHERWIEQKLLENKDLS